MRMIRAGKLDRLITFTREIEEVAASGAVSKSWVTIATVRAEPMQRSTEEFLIGFGEANAGGAVFRIRYMAGVATTDLVICDGDTYDLDEIIVLGRKRSLELRCSKAAS